MHGLGKEGGERFKEKLGKSWESDYERARVGWQSGQREGSPTALGEKGGQSGREAPGKVVARISFGVT